jgi:tripartite-type tricarboxylate transporter receptor subunit TctC
MSGEVSFMFGQPVIANMARAGKLKMLAITTPKRSPSLPDVPTLSEAGAPGFDVMPWYGLFAPAKTPDDIVQRLNQELHKLQSNKDYVDRITALGFDSGHQGRVKTRCPLTGCVGACPPATACSCRQRPPGHR